MKKHILTAAAVGAVIFFCFCIYRMNAKHPDRIDYKEFYSAVENSRVSTAKFHDNYITFVIKTDERGAENVTKVTTNPNSPLLKEFLMLHGVTVSDVPAANDVFANVLDAAFYVIFFGAIFFVFKKFISPNTFHIARGSTVRFNDVVGMDDLKRAMMQIVSIMKNPNEYRGRGIRMPKGIILEGAPGNGKTLFARALAGEAKVNFIPAKATDFESMFMAIGPAKVKLLFHKARRHSPCIIFIDEFDGIGTRRNYCGSAIETENTRIVTALLNELDGFSQNSGVLVLAATNSIHALDEALIRPGRFDARFSVPFPDDGARKRLINMYIEGKNFDAACTPDVLSKIFNGFSCAKIESVINNAALLAEQRGEKAFTLNDIHAAAKM